jgi:hypothetical protein
MSFDGLWNIVIATPIGKQAVTLDIATENGVIRGNARQGAETVAFVDPQLDGDRLRWSQSITKPFPMTIQFDLTRDGDTVTGTAKPGVLPMSRVSGARLAA